ncbi:hypothetical protein [Azospirillum rugosum]|uniref:Uncharacterized protein n=1 Tax=Azospirillum rugosum TaxID=416170 RepID=A0ABS4SEQ1_9PROT|nr:hypothetical protein [Azospirillum rugosum]MBP2291063.1 hypothetical protein [Azospirillum rugosum]MDQ0524873.1 hypothetical protein [Azospirillum rugosum]
MLRWPQKKLADEASKIAPVSVETIKSWEATNGPINGSADRIYAVTRVFEENGVELINHGKPGACIASSSQTSDDAK